MKEPVCPGFHGFPFFWEVCPAIIVNAADVLHGVSLEAVSNFEAQADRTGKCLECSPAVPRSEVFDLGFFTKTDSGLVKSIGIPGLVSIAMGEKIDLIGN